MQGFPFLIVIIMLISFSLAPLFKAAQKQNQQQRPRGVPPRQVPPGETPAAEKSLQGSLSEGSSSYPVSAPSLTVTDHDDSIYRGSLNAVTGEGYDPCHDEQLSTLSAAEKTLPPPVTEQARLPFGWTGSDIVRGVVMSEILKRK